MNPTTFGFEVLIVIVALGVVTIVLGTVIAMLLRRQTRTLEEKRRSDSRYRTVDQAGMAFSWLTPRQDG